MFGNRELRESNELLASENNRLNGEIDSLRSELEGYALASEVVEQVQLSMAANAGATDEEAMQIAATELSVDFTAKEVKKKKDEIIRDRKDEALNWLRKNDPDFDKNVSTQAQQELEQEGAFDTIKADAKAVVLMRIREQLTGAYKANLEFDENQIIAELEASPEFQDELEAIRATAATEKSAEMKDGVRIRATAEIIEEEGDKTFERFEDQVQTFKESPLGHELRKKAAKDAQKELEKRKEEVGKSELFGEEYREALERAKKEEIESLESKQIAERLLTSFEGEGIDLLGLKKGSRIEIGLGERGRHLNSNGNPVKESEKSILTIDTRRILTLIKQEGDLFELRSDHFKLSSASKEYRKYIELTESAIVIVGQEVHRSGDTKLVPRLVKGQPLFVDPDPATESLYRPLNLPVQFVAIDGVNTLVAEHGQHEIKEVDL